MKTTMIIARMGYAESGYASFLVFVNRGEPFQSGIEAVSDLAKTFLAKYLFSQEIDIKDCCAQAKGKFCSQCGASLSGLARFNVDAFEYFIKDHAIHTMDEYGESLEEFGGSWTEFANFQDILNIHPSEIIDLHTYAERVLIRSLKGDELDDDECSFKNLAPAYRDALANYDAWGPDWSDPKDHDLEKFIETCRLKSS